MNTNVCIFYFSGTGNTWWASRKLAEKLETGGRVAKCHSIEQLDEEKTTELIEDAGILFFAYPIYGSYMPEPMKRFIDDLPKSTGSKKAGIFCTQMGGSGDGAWFYHKVLEGKGYEIKWTFHFILPNNVSFRISPLPYSVNKDKLGKKFSRCEKRLDRAVKAITTDTTSLTGNNIGSLLLGLLQRPLFKMLTKKPFKGPYKVDADKCTTCMRCVKICPEGNITLVNGKITFGTECSLCMRCYNFCPETAILALGLKHNKRKLPYRGPEGFDPVQITKQKNLKDFII